MPTYQVIISEEAKAQLDTYISYILEQFSSEQAALSVYEDALDTMEELARIAGSLNEINNPKFKGYKRINFRKHNYAMIFRVNEIEHIAYVVRVFHQFEDIESKFK